MRWSHATLWWMFPLLAGCNEPVPLTTEIDCAHGELESPIATPNWRRDVLFVVPTTLVEPLDGRLRGLVRALVTGELDDEEGQDGWAIPHARVSIMNPREAQALWDGLTCVDRPGGICPYLPARFARYRWAPHGLEDDVDEFVERAMCLAPGHTRDCGSELVDGEPDFGSQGLEVFVITAHDLCGPFNENPLGCDGELTRLVADWRDTWPLWWPSVIAGFPTDLTTAAAWQQAPSRDAFLQRIDADPRMRAVGDDLCAGAGPVAVEPAPEWLREVAAFGDGVMSLCAEDYRPILDRPNCDGARDYGSWNLPADRLLDGERTQCTLDEILPADGPVTRCEQLTAFGRSEVIGTEDGREVCRVQQLSIEDAEAGRGIGFYLSSVDFAALGWPSRGNYRAPCTGFLGGDPSNIGFAGTQPILDSTLRIHCSTTAGEPELAQCTSEDDAGR